MSKEIADRSVYFVMESFLQMKKADTITSGMKNIKVE